MRALGGPAVRTANVAERSGDCDDDLRDAAPPTVFRSATGSVLKSMPSTALKSAVLAPMPSASETSTTSVQPLAFCMPRIA